MVSFTHQDAGTPESAWARSGAAALPELPLNDGELAATAFLVLAAHPDDETLGAGGLMARLHALGADVRVLLCTAGEASHPDSPTVTPERLAEVRLSEFDGALGHLLGGPRRRYLGLPDGRLAEHRAEIAAAIREAAADTGKPAERIVLVAPYRHDGHTDHDTLGLAAAETAAGHGYGLLEFPIWYWLWAAPEDAAWQDWQRFPLRPEDQQAKARAMAAHTSQVAPLSEQPGDEVLLPAGFLAHFERHWETFAWHQPRPPAAGDAAGDTAGDTAIDTAARDAGSHGAAAGYAAADAERLFDAVHGRDEDPWGYTGTWYEQRKRALTLATLPEQNYEAGLEIGCSIGTLSVELAERCGTFLAVDASNTALARAAERLEHLPAAQTRHLTVPHGWPDGGFDLIVVSEVGYYLSPEELDELFRRVEESLLPGGTLVLCHWRHPLDGWVLDGDTVHATARDRLRWAGAGLYRERDFVLEILRAPERQP